MALYHIDKRDLYIRCTISGASSYTLDVYALGQVYGDDCDNLVSTPLALNCDTYIREVDEDDPPAQWYVRFDSSSSSGWTYRFQKNTGTQSSPTWVDDDDPMEIPQNSTDKQWRVHATKDDPPNKGTVLTLDPYIRTSLGCWVEPSI